MAISVFKPGGGTGDFEFPVTDGTAGQALVTNGAGALSFATMSLPDGAIIGGVMYFNRPTKPTERSAGVPLVIGDHWHKTSDGTEWFWNGTYWLNKTEYVLLTITASNSNAQTTSMPGVIVSESNNSGQINLFVTRCLIHTREMAVNNASNYWYANVTTGGVGFGSNGISFVPPLPFQNTIDSIPSGPNGRVKISPINLLWTAVGYNYTGTIFQVGSPSNLSGHFVYLYRTVYL